MKNALIAIIGLTLLSGCSTFTPPRYTTEADNTMALRKVEIGDIAIGDFSGPNSFSNACRGTGLIAPPDNVTFAYYIREALADELKMAGLYDDNLTPRITITGKINTLNFSSTRGVTGGEWNISLTLNSSNDASMSMSEHYEFESGFFGETACKQTAEAFMGAVQNIIGKIVRSHEFKQLIK
ncbi:MAG: hypothetical protein GY928_03380 [Colwellia sp.]|nr:hypothetical protein [Colwellia sp.]